jgi:polysaccharide deacetylase family protein (PEP-CTERM system associated)
LIEEIISKGHEIASHGYSHHNIKNMNAIQFESDLKRSLEVLRKMSGEKVTGFRAPYCSINKQNLWTFDIMRKHGVRYDCSLCPVKFHYGLPEDTPRHIYRMSHKDPLKEDPNSDFIEIPMTTLKLPLIGNIPVGGGHYLRFFPLNVLRTSIKKFNMLGFPAVIYVHPHDLDSAKPHVPSAAWHNYWGLKEAADKLGSILEDFRFCSAREVITF